VRAPVAGADVAVKGPIVGDAAGAVKGTRPAYFPGAGGFVTTTVYDRYRLRPGDDLSGPAVIEEEGSTLVVGPGGRARVAASGNIILSV
jgi:N-methylhydantoinase A